MITESDFEALAAEVARLNGISRAEAEEAVAQIGDTPDLDQSGSAVLWNDGQRGTTRLRWPTQD